MCGCGKKAAKQVSSPEQIVSDSQQRADERRASWAESQAARSQSNAIGNAAADAA